MYSKRCILLALFSAALLVGAIDSAKISCITCSTADEATCARPSSLQPSECSQDGDQCFMRILNNQLVRGCFLDQLQTDQESCDASPGLCITCDENGCNSRYWPKCYSCNENNDAGCANEQSDLATAAYCKEYYSDNYCQARLSNDKVIRGCASDYRNCLGESSTCQICHSDGCNGLSKANLTTSKCQKCHSAEEDCINGTSTALSTACSRLADPCYATIEDNKVQRGCLDLATNSTLCSDPTDATCVACQGDNCNVQSWLRCHQCRVTDSDKSCNDEKTANATFCANYQAGDQCYSRTVNGVFERGCQSDLGANANACDQLSEKECQLCTDAGCNKQKNSAGSLLFNFAVLVLSVAAAAMAAL